MNIAGVTVRPASVQLLATMLDGELAAKLERAVTYDNSIVAVSHSDRDQIIAALSDEIPSGLGELRSVLLKQLAQRRKQEARDGQIRAWERARAQTSRA